MKTRIVFLAVAVGMIAGCGASETDLVEEQESALITSWGNCPPFSASDACVCTDLSWTGTCRILSSDNRFYGNLVPLALNDTITSIAVGPSAYITFFDGAGFSGVMGWLYGSQSGGPNGTGIATLVGQTYYSKDGTSSGQLNDRISSITVELTPPFHCNPGVHQVAVFNAIDYAGGGGCAVLNIGNYPISTGNATSGGIGGGWGIPNDSVSSVFIGPSTVVSLFSNANFTGSLLGLNGSVPFLSDYGFNDVTSSIQVSGY